MWFSLPSQLHPEHLNPLQTVLCLKEKPQKPFPPAESNSSHLSGPPPGTWVASGWRRTWQGPWWKQALGGPPGRQWSSGEPPRSWGQGCLSEGPARSTPGTPSSHQLPREGIGLVTLQVITWIIPAVTPELAHPFLPTEASPWIKTLCCHLQHYLIGFILKIWVNE